MRYTKQFMSNMSDHKPFRQEAVRAFTSKDNQREMDLWIDRAIKINESKIALAQERSPGLKIL